MRRFQLLAVVLALLIGTAYIPPARAATTLVVTTLLDTDDGVCDAQCSLREAIAVAASGDRIEFAVSGRTLRLALGELLIAKDLTIAGPGATQLTIDAERASRVFHIAAGTVAISGLTISGGVADEGGGIYSSAALILTEVVVTGNTANTSGGGVFSTRLASNADLIGLTVRRSTIGGNVALELGGGLYIASVPYRIEQSTIGGNASAGRSTSVAPEDIGGGGIFALNIYGGEIIDSTITGNFSDGSGGGMYIYLGFAYIVRSTITANLADSTNDGAGSGGGIFAFEVVTPTILNASIVAGNSDTVGNSGPGTIHPDLSGRFDTNASWGHNLIGTNAGTRAFVDGEHFNQVGTVAAPLDPRLAPRGFYGGPTETHPPLPGSPAIDRGGPGCNSEFPCEPGDQRGLPRLADGNADGVAAYDIGAVEIEPLDLAASAGGPYFGAEGQAVQLAGAIDPVDPGLAISWSVEPEVFQLGASCALADPGSLTTTVRCTDDGLYLLRLTIANGLNPPLERFSYLTLSNAAPVVSALGPPPEAVAGVPLTLAGASFSDAGANDTHTGVWDFGDGTTAPATLDGGQVQGITHTYAQPGVYALRLLIADDDSAIGAAELSVVVPEPPPAVPEPPPAVPFRSYLPATIVGAPGGDVLAGLGGNDPIGRGAGDDLIWGGA